MGNYSTNEFKSGLKILLDGEPCSIVENEFVKPGKGQAFNRTKIRHLRSGRILEKTFKSGETVESADVMEIEAQYLYESDGTWNFMNIDGSFEQYIVDKAAISDAKDWLKPEATYKLTLWEGRPIAVVPPNFLTLEIVETDPGLRGDTATGGNKPAKLISGATVKVPLFVQTGETIKVDTRSSEYLGRA